MKLLISTLTIILILTGCTTLGTPNLDKASKQDLIKQADNGNIKAMVTLDKKFNFAQTKKGLTYYKKWYKTINKTSNKEDIVSFAKMFKKYKDMYNNGNLKYEKLLKFADNKQAKFMLFDYYIKNYRIDDAVRTRNALIKNASKNDLEKIYNKYEIYKYKNRAGRYEYKAQEIKQLMLKKGYIKEYSNLEERYNSNDFSVIKNSADLLKEQNNPEAIKFYKKAQTLTKDKKLQAEIYYQLYATYKYILKKDKDTAIEYLKKSAKLDYEKAKYRLISEYLRDKDYKQEYKKLKDNYFKTIEGKRFFANALAKAYKVKQANKIFIDLANNKDADAIVKLAFSKSNFGFLSSKLDNEAKKWQEYIINNPSKELFTKAKAKFFESSTQKFIPNFIETIFKKDIEQNNIIIFRKLVDYYKFKNKKLAQKYLTKAIEAGDIKSKFDQINLIYLRRHATLNKAIEALKEMSDNGNIKATMKLADIFYYPSYKYKQLKNPELGIKYFEKAINLGDEIGALNSLYNIYSCKSCKENLFDLKKAKHYAELLAQKGSSKGYFELGKFYYYGVAGKKDLNKAKEYFQKSANLYNPRAYYELGLLFYKNSKVKIKVDNKKALEYFKKGAKLKNYDCNLIMGDIYLKGYLNLQKSKSKAISYYEKIAYLNKDLAFYVAYYYVNDKKDYKKAAKYFSMSLNRKTGKGYFELAYLYENGLGVKQDVLQAVQFYDKAYSLAKDKQAAFKIAEILHYGKGNVPKRVDLAKQWYKVVGTKEAKKQLKILENN
ncbi:tetratricopeptide repeat protein [Arcobacter sp. CECT 8985]|uniref:SEL1-like repeat protein n=1 Tax=Arcobacter sp. CECT 8985 TaxID=1935424 RepID=UPI00100AD594|nr:tetratricopeptide repeat protein [Arcobacter sp. CECT 8985]RXJ86188.1 hypothetical protein CRU93_09535 [Arcobacter sp. CECT 8985]